MEKNNNFLTRTKDRIRTYFKKNRLGLFAMFFTWLIFFSRTLTGRFVYFLDDLKIIYYPLEHIYATFQRLGQIPEWSNLFGFGHPVLAWGQLGFFTPLHFILRIFQLHPLTLLQVSVLTYFAIGLLGMFIFLRHRKFTQLASSFGAIVFVFSGFNIGHLSHVNFYTATMLLPWLLIAICFFINKPSPAKVAIMSLISATIALSGQPQMALYVHIAAAIFGITIAIQKIINIRQSSINKQLNTYLLKLISFSVLTIILILGLSSFATLPLFEFLPNTERNQGLSELELLEFSYPPYHAITLIQPYLFGNHEAYWGAKSYQELAAHVGIIPLMLAGLSLACWRRYKTERILGITYLLFGTIFMLGQYSPIYRYFVSAKIITTLAIPGRFTFFLVIGISILATLGFDTLFSSYSSKKFTKLISIALGLLLPAVVLAPFFWYIQNHPNVYTRMLPFPNFNQPYIYLIIIGTIAFLFSILITPRFKKTTLLILLTVTAATLISYGWNYNPLTPTNIAYTNSPFTPYLQEFKQSAGLPPRLYSSEETTIQNPYRAHNKKTNPISPLLTIHQPIVATHNNLECVQLKLELGQKPTGILNIAISQKLTSTPIQTVEIPANTIKSNDYSVCFSPLPDSQNKTYIISLSSNYLTDIMLPHESTQDPTQQAYFVRVLNPTKEQLAKSKKESKIIIQEIYSSTNDNHAGLLIRNMQPIADASSARWIGALSIRPYREFIEFFFANDREPFDGEGRHAINRNREMFNISGITHIAQEVDTDASIQAMENNNFTLLHKANIGKKEIALFSNPEAYPKAFLANNAAFVPSADDVRAGLVNKEWPLNQIVFLGGPRPPSTLPQNKNQPITGTATITRYESTIVDVKVNTDQDSVLILTDTSTPQWQTFIDDKPAPRYHAYSVFKAAIVPAGEHIVSFRYHSPAIQKAKIATTVSLLITFILLYWTKLTSAIHKKVFTKN
jgi:hypothetical protein